MSRSIKQFYEIIWILVQVLILFIFSKCFGFKDRTDNFKTMYVLISLIITIYQWLEKENFFKLLINKVFYEMGKKSCEFAKKLYEKCKNKITIEYLEPFYVLSLFFELSLSYFLNKLYIKCKNYISDLCELKDKRYILVFFGFVEYLIGLFSDILKVLYLYFSILILIKLLFSRDLIIDVLNIAILYYIYILALLRVSGKRQQNFIVGVVILIAVIIINISDFEEFISPIVVLIVIPFINWYYSETRQLISDVEKFKEPDIETKKTWAKIKSVTVFLSISVSIAVIMKKLLSTNNKKDILENNNISLIEDAFGFGKISPSMLLSVATGVIFLILWSAVLKGPGFINKYTKYKEKLKKRIPIRKIES